MQKFSGRVTNQPVSDQPNHKMKDSKFLQTIQASLGAETRPRQSHRTVKGVIYEEPSDDSTT